MSEKVIKTDAVIVGAGPAGSSTSIFLSKLGVRHVIVDKDAFPRDKVCGDACSGRTVQVIKAADAQWFNEMSAGEHVFHKTWGMTVVAPNGKSIEIPYVKDRSNLPEAKGFTVKRLLLDDFLFQRTQTPFSTVLENTAITAIQRTDQGFILKASSKYGNLSIETPVVVGADGDKGIVRRQLLQNDANAKPSAVGLRAYYDGVIMPDDHHIELHYFPELPNGYLWIFPLPGGQANVGIGMLAETVKERKINLRELFLSLMDNHPRLTGRFTKATQLGKVEGWGIPIYTGKDRLCGDGFLLTGDSGNLIDPFSGEGIGNALYSGMVAAKAIELAHKQGIFDEAFFKEYYEKEVYGALGPELEQNARMQQVFLRQWMFNAFFSKASRSKTLRNAISHMFTDAEMYKQFKKPMFYLKVLLNL